MCLYDESCAEKEQKAREICSKKEQKYLQKCSGEGENVFYNKKKQYLDKWMVYIDKWMIASVGWLNGFPSPHRELID